MRTVNWRKARSPRKHPGHVHCYSSLDIFTTNAKGLLGQRWTPSRRTSGILTILRQDKTRQASRSHPGIRGQYGALQFLSSPRLHKAPRPWRRAPGLPESRQTSSDPQQKGYALGWLRWELASLRARGEATPTARSPLLSCVNK